MQRTPQFVTGSFKPVNLFLPDEEYGRALDTLVKACSDVLVTSNNGSRVFLGKRKVEPQPDWWYIGGRVKPGETPQVGAARNVKRELGLDFPPTRFTVIANYSFAWQMRAQPPVTNGTADISTIHNLELSSDEANQTFTLDEKEYSEAKWFVTDDILRGDFHPALQQAVRDLNAHVVFTKLQRAVLTPTNTNDDDSNDNDADTNKHNDNHNESNNAKEGCNNNGNDNDKNKDTSIDNDISRAPVKHNNNNNNYYSNNNNYYSNNNNNNTTTTNNNTNNNTNHNNAATHNDTEIVALARALVQAMSGAPTHPVKVAFEGGKYKHV